MATRQVDYGASANFTITVASLATSSTLVVGRESAVVDNTSNLFLDYNIGGQITTGTSPTAGVIEIWAIGSLNDTPLYPSPATGADAALTMTSVDTKAQSLALIATLTTDTTSNRVYSFGPVSLATAFSRLNGGGLYVPKRFGVFVTHSTVAALNATGGNHILSYTGIRETVI